MKHQANKGERIAKIIARAGLASRRESEKLILDGRVKVNGKTINSPALNLTKNDNRHVYGYIINPLVSSLPQKMKKIARLFLTICQRNCRE